MTGARLQSRDDGLEHVAGVHDLEVASHHVGHAPVRAPVRECVEHVAAQQHSREAAVLDHREVLLRPREDQLEHPLGRVVRRERAEVREHGAAHGNAAQRRPHLHDARLLRRADPDEERDEDEERVCEQAEKAEPQRHRLAHVRGELCGPGVVHAQGEQGSQHPPAVHGEGGE